jgi:hypothetical protein
MKLKAYSWQTQKLYINHLRRFISFVDMDLDKVQNSDLRRYFLFIMENKTTQNLL